MCGPSICLLRDASDAFHIRISDPDRRFFQAARDTTPGVWRLLAGPGGYASESKAEWVHFLVRRVLGGMEGLLIEMWTKVAAI